MAKDPSFDIVSEINMQEMDNAVNQAVKEMIGRFDFKNSKSSIELGEKDITIASDDDFKLKSVIDILETKMIKRGISLKSLDFGKIEPASGGTVRQVAKLKQGLDQDNAKKIIKLIKDSKLKVQASVQGDQVRVTGKSRDDLQAVIQLVRNSDLPIDLQFTNYR
ncbi:YajQ family cyclic di-GMP-binding protein [Tumebacillus sp. ITR2]|uniref:Nucleotide-binding protein JJB07_17825 n=1 Tax=Tumebacillus amylolyticus TaxID=2801339 RepID=A0ABS1JDU8_9BACL|nr:YajQ family cyclic di-GMP-binding protein [Tumebacillus amylolyticus]MBL0388464.1 YajQ family cyclic di-GMP-binding protein [Tumebacillus amylolyticus]